MDDMDDFQKEFKLDVLEEVTGHLERLNELLSFQQESITIDELFRIFHSIKGASKSGGFDELSKVAHRGEDLLLKVRNGEFELDSVLEGITEVVDFMSDYTESLGEDFDAPPGDFDFDSIMQPFIDGAKKVG